ncbi:hypothetical protein A2690_02330 [Candidatus Roizmanbacteria bacterium RIFCSPHIGHO2_01_FULL_39_12b]|uniref:DUF11 domain-containing protein n=1 Tax=Candidatus Roizmanbacteria bacterium RIFCSPHIGHO2_01_FULL_39_12b TaxID=1802030 RepID=A0A1F7GDN2_9BACT|nr:MAG: hypothetical protein A2690_02330 [Candidatus Roizmanbacteria bacterium RIFCSPHIGHO2_01_FULL_39_12b]OGK46663.1 MAG: hypothetical protein A3B46_00470 [Candidatus Roizmanbacteria bacterium RIFCSPLOWO2_01_FULL_39_19]
MIKNVVFIKIISVILILLFFITPLTVLSEELPEEPTPTPTQTVITPTPTDTTQFHSTDESFLYETEYDSLNYPGDSTGSATVNTADNVNVISSDSALLNIKVETDNNTVVIRDTDVYSTTGGNSVSDNISLTGPVTLTTGNVDATATIATIVNTNVVGLNVQPIIHNLFTPLNSDLNLSNISSCQPFDESIAGDIQFNENTGNNVTLLNSDQIEQNVGVYTTNDATITNNITLTSETGHNRAVDNIGSGVELTTGDATSTANIANVANTNLIGNCGLFALFNFFKGGTGSLVLPYEIDFITKGSQNSASSVASNSGDNLSNTVYSTQSKLVDVTASNSAILSTIVTTDSNTGLNSIFDSISFDNQLLIDVGDNDSAINTIDMANMNFVDSNFSYVRVNHLGHFKGKVIGWDGEFIEGDDYFILYAKLPSTSNLQLADDQELQLLNTGDDVVASDSGQFTSILDVETLNNAAIINNIDLNANTGSNSASMFNPQITTGDATTLANIFNIVNLSVIGNNWYFAVINLFDDFFGNIIFPRPDLVLKKEVNAKTAQVGDQITYSLYFANSGQTSAKQVKLVDTLPNGVDIVSSNYDYSKKDSTLTFSLGEIVPNQTGVITMVVKINNNAPVDIINSATISTQTVEPNKDDNQSSATTNIVPLNVTTTQNSNSNQQATPTQSPLSLANRPTSYYYLDKRNIKTFHRELKLNKERMILGANEKDKLKDKPNNVGDILDGINTKGLSILMIVLMSYALGFATGVIFTRKFS